MVEAKTGPKPILLEAVDKMDVSQLSEAVKIAARERNQELLKAIGKRLLLEKSELEGAINNKFVKEADKVDLRKESTIVEELIGKVNTELHKIEGIKTPEDAIRARETMVEISSKIDLIMESFTPDKQEQLNALLVESISIQTDLVQYYFDRNPAQQAPVAAQQGERFSDPTIAARSELFESVLNKTTTDNPDGTKTTKTTRTRGLSRKGEVFKGKEQAQRFIEEAGKIPKKSLKDKMRLALAKLAKNTPFGMALVSRDLAGAVVMRHREIDSVKKQETQKLSDEGVKNKIQSIGEIPNEYKADLDELISKPKVSLTLGQNDMLHAYLSHMAELKLIKEPTALSDKAKELATHLKAKLGTDDEVKAYFQRRVAKLLEKDDFKALKNDSQPGTPTPGKTTTAAEADPAATKVSDEDLKKAAEQKEKERADKREQEIKSLEKAFAIMRADDADDGMADRGIGTLQKGLDDNMDAAVMLSAVRRYGPTMLARASDKDLSLLKRVLEKSSSTT